MQVKRFKAADMRRALEMVRSDLGDDAVILSNANHGNYVEVLATADDCTTWLATNEDDKIPNNKSVFAKYETDLDEDCLALLSDIDLASSNIAQSTEHEKITLPEEKSKSYYDFSALINSDNRESKAKSKGVAENPNKDPLIKTNSTEDNPNASKYERSYLSEQLDKLEREKQANSQVKVHPSKNSKSKRAVESIQLDNKEASLVFPENSFFNRMRNEKNKLPKRRPIVEKTHNRQVDVSQSKRDESDTYQDEYHHEIKSLQAELSGMRELLEQQLVESQQLRLKGSQLTIDRRLSTLGFSCRFRSEIHRDVIYSCNDNPSSCWRPVLGHLAKKIQTLSSDLIKSGGRLAFIGPTGAGKTTTIAKLATRYVLEFGRESIVIVTTDNERLGSQGQLKSLANILQIPMRTAQDPNQLVDVLASLDSYRLVLIDTPGVNIREINSNSWFNTLNNLNSVAKIFVTAANVQGDFQKRLINIAQEARSFAIILTKIDECLTLGESLEAVIESQLPLAYISDGQNIPSDIHLAKAAKLLALAVKLGQSKLRPKGVFDSVNSASKFKKVLGA